MKETTSKKKVVLYADDDPDDRLLLADSLLAVAPDFRVETVADGFSALTFLQKQPELPCLLILDLNMPGMSGKELMRNLKAEKRFERLPIVVFTTSSHPADKQECANYGVEMFTKPLDLKEYERTANVLISYCK